MRRSAWPILQAPWCWPRGAQHGLCVVLALLSALLCVAWRDTRDDLQAQRAQQEHHQNALHTLRWVQNDVQAAQQAVSAARPATGANSSLSLPAHMQAVKQQAEVFQLQLNALSLKHAPAGSLLTFDVQGRYASVWLWWQQVQTPFLEVQQFQMDSALHQMRLRGTWQWLPASLDGNLHRHPLTGTNNTNNTSDNGNTSNNGTSSRSNPADVNPHAPTLTQHIGFDAAAWQQAQRWQAQQSPSYVQWVVPLLKHAPQALEQFSLHQLRYEGSLVQANRRLALVRVLNDVNLAQPVALLQEGAFLGTDLGQLLAITPEHLWVREVVRNALGEWGPRWVRLPLGQVLPAPQGDTHHD